MCDCQVAQINHLGKHMRTHTADEPYKCDQCIYRTPHMVDLWTHMRTHTGEKP